MHKSLIKEFPWTIIGHEVEDDDRYKDPALHEGKSWQPFLISETDGSLKKAAKGVIYALWHKSTPRLAYIGYTQKMVLVRRDEHIRDALVEIKDIKRSICCFIRHVSGWDSDMLPAEKRALASSVRTHWVISAIKYAWVPKMRSGVDGDPYRSMIEVVEKECIESLYQSFPRRLFNMEFVPQAVRYNLEWLHEPDYGWEIIKTLCKDEGNPQMYKGVKPIKNAATAAPKDATIEKGSPGELIKLVTRALEIASHEEIVSCVGAIAPYMKK
jgi:hypothetical protein